MESSEIERALLQAVMREGKNPIELSDWVRDITAVPNHEQLEKPSMLSMPKSSQPLRTWLILDYLFLSSNNPRNVGCGRFGSDILVFYNGLEDY